MPPDAPPRLITLYMVEQGGLGGMAANPAATSPSDNADTTVSATSGPAPGEALPPPAGRPAMADRLTEASPPASPSPSTQPAPARQARSSKAPASAEVLKKRTTDTTGQTGSAAGSATALTSPAAQAGAGSFASSDQGAAGTGSNDGNLQEPVLTSFSKPAYPRRSRQAGEEGKVVVEAHVSARGTLLQAVVLQSSGFVRLDEAARNSLARARFQPALRQGRPVEGRLRVPFVFNLRDEEGA